jgi:hypothetical protein
MRYALRNIRINRGVNSRGQYEWLQAELFNDVQPWANPARLPQFPSMTKEYIDLFKEDNDANLEEIPEYKTVVNGQTVLQVFRVKSFPKVETIAKRLKEQGAVIDDAEALSMAENMLKNAITHISHIHSVIQPLEGLWQPVYRRETTINGTTYPKGSPRIGQDGKPVPAVRSLRVIVRQGYDEDANDGKGGWVDVENPEDIANLMLERRYTRIEEQAAQPRVNAGSSSIDDDINPSGKMTDEEKAQMQKRIEEMQKLMNDNK